MGPITAGDPHDRAHERHDLEHPDGGISLDRGGFGGGCACLCARLAMLPSTATSAVQGHYVDRPAEVVHGVKPYLGVG